MTDNRPAFQKMIRDSAHKKFEFVIVHKLDRFARNQRDSLNYRFILKQNGVSLRSVIEKLDDSPESGMVESMYEGMAEYFSKNLARETMKGLMENAYSCRHTGGSPPLGYDVDPITRKLVINAAEAVIVREIFKMYDDGAGYQEIVNHFNGKVNAHKTKPDEEIVRIEDGIPQIINKELFGRIQEKMSAKKLKTAAFKAKESYLLSGKITYSESAPIT